MELKRGAGAHAGRQRIFGPGSNERREVALRHQRQQVGFILKLIFRRRGWGWVQVAQEAGRRNWDKGRRGLVVILCWVRLLLGGEAPLLRRRQDGVAAVVGRVERRAVLGQERSHKRWRRVVAAFIFEKALLAGREPCGLRRLEEVAGWGVLGSGAGDEVALGAEEVRGQPVAERDGTALLLPKEEVSH